MNMDNMETQVQTEAFSMLMPVEGTEFPPEELPEEEPPKEEPQKEVGIWNRCVCVCVQSLPSLEYNFSIVLNFAGLCLE